VYDIIVVMTELITTNRTLLVARRPSRSPECKGSNLNVSAISVQGLGKLEWNAQVVTPTCVLHVGRGEGTADRMAKEAFYSTSGAPGVLPGASLC
jgi:hypothetical protein